MSIGKTFDRKPHVENPKRIVGWVFVGCVMLLCSFCASAGDWVNNFTMNGVKWYLEADKVEGSYYWEHPDERPATTSVTFTEWDGGSAPVVSCYYNMTLTGFKYTTTDYDRNIVIPKQVMWDSGGSLGVGTGPLQYITANAFYNKDITSVVIPAGILGIRLPCFRKCGDLKSIIVGDKLAEMTNPAGLLYYASQDGVLYNADKTELLKYPEGKEGDFFIVPATVTNLATYCLADTKLKAVLFAGGCPNVSDTAFSGSGFVVYRYSESNGWPEDNFCGMPIYDFPKSGERTEMCEDGVEKTVYYALEDGVLYGYSVKDGAATIEFVPRDFPFGAYEMPDALGGHPVVGVGARVFYNSTGLTSVTLPQTLRNIGDLAFYNCSELTSVTFPQALLSIGDRAFQGCKIGALSVPDSVTNIGEYAFSSCRSLGLVELGTGIDRISNGCFYYSTMPSMTIPNTVKHIGQYAFLECYEMERVSLPVALESVGEYAFQCSGVKDVSIPNSVTNIGDGAFSDCVDLSNIHIPYGIERIGYATFSGCESLSLVSIPYSVTEIGNYAFQSCTGMVGRLKIPGSVKEVSGSAFAFCEGLDSIELLDGVERIGPDAFAYCTGIKEVVLPDSLMSIDVYAFEHCSELESIFFGDGIESIEHDAFVGCDKLGSIAIPQQLCEGAFPGVFGGFPVTNVVMNDSVTSISARAFMDCRELKNVSIPNGVNSIGSYAFSGCSNLVSIVFGGNAPDMLGAHAFDGVDETCTVYVPTDSTGWGVSIPGTWNGVRIEYAEASGPQPVFRITNGRLVGVELNGATEITIPKTVEVISQLAFRSCTNLVSMTIPSTVTNVQLPAFAFCRSLESVKLCDGVRTIWPEAFFGCANLKSVTIPNSVTNIGDRAFYRSGLTNVTIPDSVKIIGREAFRICTNLTSVVFSGGVEEIGDSAFEGCFGLTNVTIPDSVYIIGREAFVMCTNLTSVVVSGVLEEIGDYAFEDCYGLTNVTILGSVDSIGEAAFRGCDNLTSIIFSGGVAEIGNYAFEDCYGLTNVTMLGSVEEIGRQVFEGCTNITCATISDAVCRAGMKYVFGSACQSITNVVVSEGVTTIYGSAFSDCLNLLSVSLPQTLVDIENGAFMGCRNLEGILIPDNVARIGNYAFSGCRGLTNITFGGGVRSVGDSAFSYCTSLTDVVIPDRVTSIGGGAFEKCTNITSVTISQCVCNNGMWNVFGSARQFVTNIVISDGVTSIRHGAFQDCSRLTHVTIPDSVRKIERQAFVDCGNSIFDTTTVPGVVLVDGWAVDLADDGRMQTIRYLNLSGVRGIAESVFQLCFRLTMVTMSDSMKCIGDYAFSNCMELKSVVMPDSVTYIGDGAFRYCRALESVAIPASVAYIGAGAFASCDSLAAFEVAAGNSVFKAESGLLVSKDGRKLVAVPGSFVQVNVPDDVVSIGSYAFYGCSKLTDVTIPDSVTEIGGFAFYGCSRLPDVVIPDSVTSIGGSAFAYCRELTSVTIPNGVTNVGARAFAGCSGLASFAVSEENMEYKAENGYLLTKKDAVLVSAPGGFVDATIPDGVTRIGEGAFYGSVNLASVAIPNSVTNIGPYAFYNCSSLASVMVGGRVKSIEDCAFEYCNSLTSVVLPSSMERIGPSAFYDCTNLSCVVFLGDAPSVVSYTFGSLAPECVALVSPSSLGWDCEIPGTWNNLQIEYIDESPEIQPSIASVQVNGTPVADGEISQSFVAAGVPVKFDAVISGPDQNGIANGVVTCWTVRDGMAGHYVYKKFYTTNYSAKASCKYTFAVSGERSLVTVKVQDKNMAATGEWSPELAFYVDVEPPPSVAIVTSRTDRHYAEDSTDGYVNVRLSTPASADLMIEIVAARRGSDGVLALATNVVTVTAGEIYGVPQSIFFTDLDGTADSRADGFLITASVTTGRLNEYGVPWNEYYRPGSEYVYIDNVAPVIMKPAVSVITNKAALNSQMTFPWSIKDIAEDLTNGLTVTWTSSGGTQTTFTGPDVSTGVYTNTFNSLGDHQVIMLVEDKDGGQATRTWSFKVESTNTIDSVAAPVIVPGDGSTFFADSCTVAISCQTEGAAIYYSTSGKTPKISESYRYVGPFQIYDTATIRAVAVCVDGETTVKSDYVSATIAKRMATLEEAVSVDAASAGLQWTTDEGNAWTPIVDETTGSGLAVRSGAIGDGSGDDYSSTWLQVVVSGPGTLSFKWKTDCEWDDSGDATWDHLAVATNGVNGAWVEVARTDGSTPWTEMSIRFADEGEHGVRWTYCKDECDSDGEDCAWISEVSWTPDEKDTAFETDFAPVQGGGEIEGMELLPSGKLIVKTTGTIGGVPVQYVILGTNTSNFAQSAFANSAMHDLNSMVFDKNYIYATRENDTSHVYRFTVDDTEALNGVKRDVKVYNTHDAYSVLCVNDDVIYTQNQDKTNTFAINAEGETATPPSVYIPYLIKDNNYVYAVSNDGMIYYWEGTKFEMYNPELGASTTLGTSDVFGEGENPVSMVSIDEINTFTLTDAGNVYKGVRDVSFFMRRVAGISYGPDGTSLVATGITSASGRVDILSYETETGFRSYVYSLIPSERFTQKEASANGIKYRATNKKIGYGPAD